METTVTQRISRIYEELGLTQNKFAQEIGIAQTTISAAIKRNNDVTNTMLNAIVVRFPEVNSDWLITGRGEMFHPKKVEIVNRFDDSPLKEVSVIPLFPDWVAATAGFEVQSDDLVPDSHIILPNMPKCDGAILVRGDSMYPILKAGDYVCFKMLPSEIGAIAFGDMYIIDYELGGDEMVSVKYIDKSERGDDYIKLVSYNPHFSPVDIPLTNVRKIARVKISIRLH
ncbi:MAG: helix-turn-helix transcriptional regulator [Muribaculaceae bacterium]|nr:helix-turn-helix transcriptional regulator [Muribaculaceae bacterium]